MYEKIKNSLINKCANKEEKFSIINDIYTFISNFNSKYKTKLDFNIILQSEEEDLLIIEKVSNYLLEIFLDYYAEEDKNIKDNINNEEEVEKHNKNKNNIQI